MGNITNSHSLKLGCLVARIQASYKILLWVEGGDLSVGAVEGAVCDLGAHMLPQEGLAICRYTSTHQNQAREGGG